MLHEHMFCGGKFTIGGVRKYGVVSSTMALTHPGLSNARVFPSVVQNGLICIS